MKSTKNHVLSASWFDTPLGEMTALADEQALYLLEFTDCRFIEHEINRLKEKTLCPIVPGETEPLRSIQQELDAYFEGTLKQFETPLQLLGSPFRVSVWEALTQIPYGETRSYANVAAFLGKPTAYRAVAQANGNNQFAIVIPCHRVINNNGELGGYGRGLSRKEWLINHEKRGKIEQT